MCVMFHKPRLWAQIGALIHQGHARVCLSNHTTVVTQNESLILGDPKPCKAQWMDISARSPPTQKLLNSTLPASDTAQFEVQAPLRGQLLRCLLTSAVRRRPTCSASELCSGKRLLLPSRGVTIPVLRNAVNLSLLTNQASSEPALSRIQYRPYDFSGLIPAAAPSALSGFELLSSTTTWCREIVTGEAPIRGNRREVACVIPHT